MAASPESSVSSLLATSGRLQSSLHPEPIIASIRYKDKHYASASDALDAYIRDFQRSQTGTLELPKERSKPQPRNRDVLKTSLTDGELNFLNIPVRKRDCDGLSVTTDDLLALPNDGSLPVTRTSALLSRSGRFPMGLSFNSSSRSRSAAAQKRSMRRLPMDDLLMGGLRSHREAPPLNILLANQTLPPDTPRSSYLPRWMTSQKSEMDFSGMTSVPDLKYPMWLGQCEGSSEGQRSERPLRVPSWVADLEESDTKDGQMLNTPVSLCGPLKEHNSSADTEDALNADRSWDNPPVAFKSPVPVGGADEQQLPEEFQRSKSAASGSSGYSSRKHPGPVEALKHMLFRLQDVELKISQSHATSEAQTPQMERETLEPSSSPPGQTENTRG
ncbi:lung adenoma susceptibility protein 2 isoform X2 [Pseudorasbora parva]|uniref:lung adenoma susceptibility protein 2 isoform X2 n=1 Tax=Pseudorasbora parva TaxID=51549 RepID=UPI00351DB517